MDIVYNLKKFFIEQQDEAAIPGLGIFYKSETLEDGTALPEGEFVILFKEKAPRSNAFVNFLGYEENLIESESLAILEEWVSSILSDLKQKGRAKIGGLGIFEIGSGKVIFTPEGHDKAKSGHTEYGLDPAEPDQKKKTKTVKNKAPKAEKPPVQPEPKDEHMQISPWLIIAAALILLIGTTIACYRTIPKFRFFTDKTAYNITHMFDKKEAKPITIEAFEETAEEIELAADDAIEAVEDVTNVQSVEDYIIQDNQTERVIVAKPDASIFVIGGSFAVKSNAEKFRDKMSKDGYEAEIIFDGQRQLNLVSLASFDDMNEAISFKNKVRNATQIDCWIYKK